VFELIHSGSRRWYVGKQKKFADDPAIIVSGVANDGYGWR
jgi:hypothetical protein